MCGWRAAAMLLAILGSLICSSHHSKLTSREEQQWIHRVEQLLDALERREDDSIYYSADEAKRWMADTNEDFQKRKVVLAQAAWNFTTNLTDATTSMFLLAKKEYSKWYQDTRQKGLKFHTKHLSPDLCRQFALFTLSSDPREPELREKIQKLLTDMQTVYNTATVCLHGHGSDSDTRSQGCQPLEPDLQDLMAESRDPETLKAAWLGWRDASGRPIRDMYRQFAALSNYGAIQNGYADSGEAWRRELFYDTQDLQSMVDSLWQELRPLYLQLHAYVRRRLREKYGEEVIGTDGTIPAHVLGNMWAQNWINIFPLVTPYPEAAESEGEIDEILKNTYTEMDLFRLAETFFASIGLFNMTDKFWQNSMFLKPRDRNVQCHASAEDMFSADDFRIKMCTEVNGDYLETVHHEMGHVEYFMAYAHQPTVYRDSPNCAFHEAAGDTISLSVSSRTHLHILGLDSGATVDKYKQSINDLLKVSLFKVGFLPFGLLVDKWRWQVFSNKTTSSTYNRDWWQLRLDIQGIRAPVPRSEKDFDPGAKFHVPSHSPYICYFVSFVAQFQFYKSLCEASGHTGPIFLCDYYGSREAGAKFKRMLALGSSRPWQDAMESLTGTRQVSAQALLEYFQPLQQWLENDNAFHNERPGWDGATINWGKGH